ncbi:MAG: MarR family transcriptional regulator [Nocardioides sp.]|nr:MarR family transcriptional regulator [Nocardioides sp.]
MGNPNDQIEAQLFTMLRATQAIQVRTATGEALLERSTYGILCLLDDEGPQRLGAIAHRFHLDPSTITRQVQTVVRLGLAEKVTDTTDRRASVLSLTGEGQSAVTEARIRRRGVLDAILKEWTAAEREEFLRAITRFNNTVDGWAKQTEGPR